MHGSFHVFFLVGPHTTNFRSFRSFRIFRLKKKKTNPSLPLSLCFRFCFRFRFRFTRLSFNATQASVMHTFERPGERLMQEQDAWERETITRQFITRLFRFYDIPIRRGLATCRTCAECYDGYTIPGGMFEGVYYPPQSGVYPEENGERWYRSASDMCAGPEEEGCFLICSLIQPSLAQVEACRQGRLYTHAYIHDVLYCIVLYLSARLHS